MRLKDVLAKELRFSERRLPWRIISAVFVAMFIAPFQALKRWASSED